MLVYLPMYGDGQKFFVPVDTDSPPAWVKKYGFVVLERKDEQKSRDDTLGIRGNEADSQ